MEYEIHLTVKSGDIPKFKADCETLGVKPILIETENNKSFGEQLMTSSKHNDNNYKETLCGLKLSLISMGYEVIREKIEIKPLVWTKHPHHVYYESHLRLELPKNFDRIVIEKICKLHGFHLSKNLFKVGLKFNYQMITYRSNTDDYRTFVEHIDKVKQILSNQNIICDKTEIEECVFDSNINVDKNWLTSMENKEKRR